MNKHLLTVKEYVADIEAKATEDQGQLHQSSNPIHEVGRLVLG